MSEQNQPPVQEQTNKDGLPVGRFLTVKEINDYKAKQRRAAKVAKKAK